MKLLVIEDDIFFTKKLKDFLEKENISVSIAHDAEEGEMKIKNNIFDVILLDMALPGMNGKDFLESIRWKKNNTPVIVLSATNTVHKKVEMLKIGADDFLTKPCSAIELLAKIHAVCRRANHKSATDIVRVGELSLDLAKKEVRVRNQLFVTTSTEYRIIELMMRNPGQTVSKENFMGYLYDPSEERPNKKILDVFLCKLRRKIVDILGDKVEYIETCWAVGYKLKNLPPVEYVEEKPEINHDVNADMNHQKNNLLEESFDIIKGEETFSNRLHNLQTIKG